MELVQMGISDKFLNKSNSYKYYKENCERLKNNEKILEDEIKQLKNVKKQNSSLKSKINNLNKQIELLEKRIEYSSDLIRKDLKEINIAYVLNSFPNLSETFIVNEIKWLAENGYNIKVFFKRDSPKAQKLNFDVEIVKFNNMADLEELLVVNQIDLMHTHFVMPVCNKFTYPVSKKLGIPFTVFAHAYDIFIDVNAQSNNVGEVSRSKYCKAIFTLSEYHRNYLIDYNVEESKIVITKQATGYELSDINPKDDRIRKIISISRFVEKKGLDVLIDAAKLLEDEDFIFEIYGFGKLEPDLQKQIDDLNCGNISIKGELDPDEVEGVLSNSDLLVSPVKIAKNGDRDGFPTVIFESMANGLPVLTTNVSAIPEIIKDYDNGFIIEPENPQLLANKIIEISKLSNEELFEIRKKAQEDVKNISSVEKTMNKYFDTIKDFMCD